MGVAIKAVDMEIRTTIKNILLLILHNILEHPEACRVEIIVGDMTTQFEVDMHRNDYGRFLGSSGKTIKAVRTVISTMGASNGFRAIISVKDEDRFFKS